MQTELTFFCVNEDKTLKSQEGSYGDPFWDSGDVDEIKSHQILFRAKIKNLEPNCLGMTLMRVERGWCWEREPTESFMLPGESSVE